MFYLLNTWSQFHPHFQGYGLTETCACGAITSFEELSAGSVSGELLYFLPDFMISLQVGPPVQAVNLRLVNWEEGNYKVTDSPNPR